jgi:peptide/nickel transport system substrate-binding protein
VPFVGDVKARLPRGRRAPRARAGAGLVALAAAAAALSCTRSPEAPPERFEVGLAYRPLTLDPHAFTTAAHSSYLPNVYERLVNLDGEMRLQPELAETWSNPDPLRLVLRLRRGVRFHRGGTLRASDVVYSLQRVLGAPELEASYYLVDVEAVRALDDFTVEVRTRRPHPALLNRLAFVYIVPEGSAERLAREADGTGPFAVAGWRPGEALRLQRHATYRRPVWLGEVSLNLGLSAEEIEEGLSARRFDLAVVTDTTLRTAPPGYRIVSRDSLHVNYLAFDVASPVTPFSDHRPNPFRDARVRRAIHTALDRPALATALPGATPMWQLVPPVVFGFNTALAKPGPDVAAARALLEGAGVGSGFGATLHTRSFLEPAARWVASQLQPLGIRVQVEVLPEDRYFEALKRRELSLWLDNWGCSTGESGELFENAMHSPDPEAVLGRFNESGFRSAEIDALIEASRGLVAPFPRRRALEELMRLTMEAAPWVPLYVDREYFAVAEPYRFQPPATLRLPLAEITRETR